MKKLFIALLFIIPSLVQAQNWDTGLTQIYNDNSNQDTLATGAYDTTAAIILIGDTSGDDSIAVLVSVTISVEFLSSPDDDADIFILTSPDNATWDTQETPYVVTSITEATSEVRVKTFSVLPGPQYMKVVVFNDDSADSIYITGWISVSYSLDNT